MSSFRTLNHFESIAIVQNAAGDSTGAGRFGIIGKRSALIYTLMGEQIAHERLGGKAPLTKSAFCYAVRFRFSLYRTIYEYLETYRLKQVQPTVILRSPNAITIACSALLESPH